MEKVKQQAYFNLNILVRLTKKYVKLSNERYWFATFSAKKELT
ncbi:hypothetical protein [Myroides odoratus]